MYEKMDELIVAAIKSGRSQFYSVDAAKEVRDETIRIAHEQGLEDRWRITDRRLQALRKRGVIAYDHKTGWRVIDAAPQQREGVIRS